MTEPQAEKEPEPGRRQWLGYWSMIVQQTQNAFNDKAAQFVLVPLGAAVGFGLPVEDAAAVMIALPFILFAPVAGWLSDRFSKRDVMLAMAVLQVLVLGVLCAAVWWRNLPLALGGFFALAVQSAFFSPAKIGINKELLGSRHLGFAAGFQQMTAMLAILSGQVVAGWWFDKRLGALGGTPDAAWQAALLPLLILAASALPALALALLIPRVPAHQAPPFRGSLCFRHFQSLGSLWADPGLRLASFGVAFFWGFAAFINLWSVKLAKGLTGGGEGFGTLSSLYMAAASLGMVAGFGASSWLLRRRIELGWVPLGGLAMSLWALALVFLPSAGWWIPAALVGLAFSSAMFLAPLNAWMQDRYPPDQRGDLQSAVNLQDCLAGILALALLLALDGLARALGLAAEAAPRVQIGFIGLLSAGMTLWILRLLPADFLRLLCLGVVRTLYRVRVRHGGRLPAEGGVLLLPNHVTYADAFFLSAASTRPLRFVMDEAFTAHRAVRIFTALFDTVTIRRDQPLEAIRVTIDALRRGQALCLFPEGQLTRSGQLCPLRKGFELIARKAGMPVLPVWVDGSWASVFSFERGRYFRKWPQRLPVSLCVAFGREIPAAEVSLDRVRHAMMRASASAVADRFLTPGWGARLPAGGRDLRAAFRELGEYRRRRAWINGHQFGQVEAVPHGTGFGVYEDAFAAVDMPGLLIAFPELFGRRLEWLGVEAEPAECLVGGRETRERLLRRPPSRRVVFFDFSSEALRPLDVAGVVHCPGLAVDGMVVSLNLPDPPEPRASSEPQCTLRPGTWGKPLPGWYFRRDENGAPCAMGPAAPKGGLPLPPGCLLDDDHFLIPGGH